MTPARRETRIYYPANRLILLSQAKTVAIATAPYGLYELNADAFRTLVALGNGGTGPEVAARLGTHTPNAVSKTISFLEAAQLKGLVTDDPRRAGRMCVKTPNTSPTLARMFVEVTRRCNLACAHCYMDAHEGPPAEDMPLSAFLEVIRQSAELGAYRLDLTGGEPFVRGDTFAILEAARDAFMVTCLFTNGVLLTKEHCQRLAELGTVSRVYISLDDPDECDHDLFRGSPGAFQATVSAVKWLHEVGMKTTINISLTDDNVARVSRLYALAEELGVDHRIGPVLSVGRAQHLSDAGPLAPEKVAAMQYWRSIHPPQVTCEIQREPELFDCGLAHRMLFIRADGEICLCPTLTSREDPQFRLGHMFTDKLRQVWEKSEALERFRNSSCRHRDCSRRAECRGGCRSRAFLQSGGDLYARDPVCCAVLGAEPNGATLEYEAADSTPGGTRINTQGHGHT